MERTLTKIYEYMHIGTINAGTIRGKTEEIVDLMQERQLKVLGIAETRLQGQGRKTVHGDYELIYSGSERDTRHGVGLFFHPDLAVHIEKVHYISNRIVASILNINKYRVSFIQAYAPQQGRPQEEKDEFYERLQDTLDTVPIDSEIIVMGDLNGHVGSRPVEGVVGNFGVGMRNEEGEMLIDFCVRNNLSVMNTYFKHQESHQYTWYRYNSRIGQYDLKTQIDFILTTRKSVIKDVKAIPSVSLDSDHRLVKGKMKIHLPEKEKSKVRKRVKTENLKTSLPEIQLKLTEIRDSVRGEDIEEHWGKFRHCLHEIQEKIVGVATLGNHKKKKTGWWTEDVKAEVDKKKKLFRIWLKNRTVENREAYVKQRNYVNQVKKRARKGMWARIGNDLHEDVKGTKKLLYSMSKAYKTRSDGRSKNTTLKDKSGVIITGQNNVANRWAEYFQELLNVNDEENQQGKSCREPTPPEPVASDQEDLICMEEIEAVLKLTKNNKAPGPDMIPIETIKAGGQPLKDMLLELFNRAWVSGTVPEEWNQSLICPIFKNKGDPLDCKNYRGISLMSHVGKLYERILERRLRKKVEEMLSESQCGFRPGRGTIDQIAALRLYLEKSWEYAIDQHICFLDLEKAFDRVPREKMWKVVEDTGISSRLLMAIKSTYNDQKSAIIGDSNYFNINTGVRQGSVLSPLLFIIYLNHILVNIKREDFHAECLGYADDVAQTADSRDKLQDIMNQWDRELTKAGLKMSYSKTEYMQVGRDLEKGDVIVNGHVLEKTDNFTYLGSKITSNNLMEEEVNNRITKFTRNLIALYPLMKEKEIPKDVKVCIYTTVLRPVLLYGSETWTLTSKLKSRIQATEMRVLRLIYGVTRRDRVRNEVIRQTLKAESVLTIIERNLLRWYGHVERMPDSRDVKRIHKWKPNKKRPIGRPRKRWEDQIKEIARREEMDFNTVKTMTQDRQTWRGLIRRLSTDRPIGLQASG